MLERIKRDGKYLTECLAGNQHTVNVTIIVLFLFLLDENFYLYTIVKLREL